MIRLLKTMKNDQNSIKMIEKGSKMVKNQMVTINQILIVIGTKLSCIRKSDGDGLKAIFPVSIFPGPL